MQNSSDTLPTDASRIPQDYLHNGKADDTWQLAMKRVVLYLQALDSPEEQCTELVREILQYMEQKTEQTDEDHPAARAMQALQSLLNGQHLAGAQDSPDNQMHLVFQHTKALFGEITSMPPLNRGSMSPVEIDRHPWRTFFVKKILRRK